MQSISILPTIRFYPRSIFCLYVDIILKDFFHFTWRPSKQLLFYTFTAQVFDYHHSLKDLRVFWRKKKKKLKRISLGLKTTKKHDHTPQSEKEIVHQGPIARPFGWFAVSNTADKNVTNKNLKRKLKNSMNSLTSHTSASCLSYILLWWRQHVFVFLKFKIHQTWYQTICPHEFDHQFSRSFIHFFFLNEGNVPRPERDAILWNDKKRQRAKFVFWERQS